MVTPFSLSMPFRTARTRSAPRERPSILARYATWLRRLNDAQSLHEIEPHMARDMGVAPGADRCPEGYAVDPRPLWGIGLTPMPGDELPPWSRRRGR